MYLASIVLLLFVLPAGCVIGQMLWFGGAADVMLLVGKWLCAPKARIISGGRFHPESCRLIR
jgi:hypothetical protein